MKIAFKKNPKTFITRLICWWTRKKSYHCELVFNNGESFSAIPEKNRTMFHVIDFPEEFWDVYELPFNTNQVDELLIWCYGENNCKYDWTGIILTQILPFSFQSKTKWFCSELCMAALQELGWFANRKPYQYAPGELQELVVDKLKEFTNGKKI